MSRDYDYAAIEVPDDKDPSDFHWSERRAEILEIVIRNGSPFINQSRLAERYDVNPSTISRDMDKIEDDVRGHLGRRASLMARSAMEDVINALDDAIDEGDWRAAETKFRVVMSWQDYLADRGAIERAPAKHEIDATVREAESGTEAYEIIPDDEAEALTAETVATDGGDAE